MKVRAADMMRYEAAGLFDEGNIVVPKPTWPSTWPPRPAGRRQCRADCFGEWRVGCVAHREI